MSKFWKAKRFWGKTCLKWRLDGVDLTAADAVAGTGVSAALNVQKENWTEYDNRWIFCFWVCRKQKIHRFLNNNPFNRHGKSLQLLFSKSSSPKIHIFKRILFSKALKFPFYFGSSFQQKLIFWWSLSESRNERRQQWLNLWCCRGFPAETSKAEDHRGFLDPPEEKKVFALKNPLEVSDYKQNEC